MKEFRYKCYALASNIVDVIEQLTTLDQELKDSSLRNLVAFNHTYLIITTNVYHQFGKQYFVDEPLMNSIDSNFGNLYFQALNNFVHQTRCPPAWLTLFNECKENKLFQFMYMALGVNAHVNNDLPQTLHLIMNGNRMKKDYVLINEVIKKSLHGVISSLQEKDPFMQESKIAFEPIYSHFLNYLIKKWRNNAWEQYQQLQQIETTLVRIESQAQKKALTLSKIKTIYHLPQLIFN